MDLQDRAVIVTGASRGIGRQIALGLGQRGASVAVAARAPRAGRTLPGSAAETVTQIEASGGRAMAVDCDVAEAADLERLVRETVARFGRLDVVINNAADMVGGDLETLVSTVLGRAPAEPTGVGSGVQEAPADPHGGWLRQFATNVHAPYILTGLAVPHMEAQGGGVVVNITSASAEMVDVGWLTSLDPQTRSRRNDRVGYATTKAALNRMTNAAAAELAARRIAVVAVDPGTTRTEVADLFGERGLLDVADYAPMGLTVDAVIAILTSEDPMAFSGRVVRADSR